MGFLSRLLVPRGLRRALHPVRTVKRAATPKVVKRARRSLSPIDNAAYSMTRALNTKPSRSKGKSYRHGSCSIKHRSREAAMKCRNP